MAGPFALAAELLPGLDPRLVAAVSLSLIVGGLVMIGVVIVVTVTFNLLPLTLGSASAAVKEPPKRVLPMPDLPPTARPAAPRAAALSIDDLQRGRALGARLKVKRVDDVLDYVHGERLAEPRILNVRAGLLRLAFLNCSECRSGEDHRSGCGYRAGILEGALGQLHKPLKVMETACHRRGDSSCEFEVTFA